MEEPAITSIAVAPGRVDTDMQKLIRDSGKDSMAEKDHASFVAAHADGQLVKPEQPGTVIANFATRPEASLTGKFLKYVRLPEIPSLRADSPQVERVGAGGIPWRCSLEVFFANR